MITWILSIWANPLARKIITYVAVLAAILYGLRLWGNRQWAKGEMQGRQHVAADLVKAKRAAWVAKEGAIAQAAQNIDAEKRAVEAAAEQIKKDRLELSKALASRLDALQQERERQYANAAAVPDNRVWSDIRAISGQLSAHP